MVRIRLLFLVVCVVMCLLLIVVMLWRVRPCLILIWLDRLLLRLIFVFCMCLLMVSMLVAGWFVSGSLSVLVLECRLRRMILLLFRLGLMTLLKLCEFGMRLLNRSVLVVLLILLWLDVLVRLGLTPMVFMFCRLVIMRLVVLNLMLLRMLFGVLVCLGFGRLAVGLVGW